MTKAWFKTHLEKIQKRYLFGSGLFALFFAHNFVRGLELRHPIFLTMLMGYLSSRVIGLAWRYLSNQELVTEFTQSIPSDIRTTMRFKKIFMRIMHHERGLWIGWCNALGYALVLTTMPIIPIAFMSGLAIYTLWHHYKLTELEEFVQRMEIHGWEKLEILTSDPFLKEIDQLPLRRTSAAFLYTNLTDTPNTFTLKKMKTVQTNLRRTTPH